MNPSKTAFPWIKFRLGLAYTLFALFLCAVLFRLFQLQVFPSPDLGSLAKKQFSKREKLISSRLPIFDRNGEELAVTLPARSAFARPKLVKDKKRVAQTLSKVLGEPSQKWLEKLKSPRPFVWLQRQLTPELADKLSKKKLPGIYVEPSHRRFYPNGSLAAAVLGFTDIDGSGLSGLELYLNQELLEPDNSYVFYRDGRGKPTYLETKYVQRSGERRGVYTTLDRRIQHAVEEELKEALETHQAQAALAIVLDPRSGEIYALAQQPSFDPNRISQYPAERRANRITSHLYEPGSTLKPILAAQALEQKILNRQSLVDCKDGKLTIGKNTLNEAETSHRFGWISLEKVIRYSSNIGAAQISQKLGGRGVEEALKRFCLTQKQGIAHAAETSLPPKPLDFWTPMHLATAGFGQGVSFTPLQMVMAYTPFANGGFHVRPKLVIENSRLLATPGMEVTEHRSISPETAETMKQILVSVTEGENGTGKAAKMDGWKVAGKTGTAQKFDPVKGYAGGKYLSSFIGFLPAENPELLIGVMIDEPRKDYYAAEVAAPLFKKIATRTAALLNLSPKKGLDTAGPAVASAWGTASKTEPPGPKVSQRKDKSPEIPQTEFNETPTAGPTMPDLRGMTLYEALQTLELRLDRIQVVGSGFITEQVPDAGTPLSQKTKIQLSLSPESDV